MYNQQVLQVLRQHAALRPAERGLKKVGNFYPTLVLFSVAFFHSKYKQISFWEWLQ